MAVETWLSTCLWVNVTVTPFQRIVGNDVSPSHRTRPRANASDGVPERKEATMSISQFIRRHPLGSYFFLTYSITWVGVSAAAGPEFLRGEEVQFTDGMLMLAAMLAGPSVSGLVCTRVVEGKSGLRDLYSRMRRWRVGLGWYAAAGLIPPVLILITLAALSQLISPAFTPGLTPTLIFGGLLAGYFEEIGWTGFATPRMKSLYGALTTGILLGVIWGVWHLAADYLGASDTFGSYWLPRFLAMWIAGMTATRVLMLWVYSHTESVLLIQIMHASSTGFLLFLSPTPVSPADETTWFAVYAAVLWVVALIVIATQGRELTRRLAAAGRGAQ